MHVRLERVRWIAAPAVALGIMLGVGLSPSTPTASAQTCIQTVYGTSYNCNEWSSMQSMYGYAYQPYTLYTAYGASYYNGYYPYTGYGYGSSIPGYSYGTPSAAANLFSNPLSAALYGYGYGAYGYGGYGLGGYGYGGYGLGGYGYGGYGLGGYGYGGYGGGYGMGGYGFPYSYYGNGY